MKMTSTKKWLIGSLVLIALVIWYFASPKSSPIPLYGADEAMAPSYGVKGDYDVAQDREMTSSYRPMEESAGAGTITTDSQKVIQTASLSLHVEDVRETTEVVKGKVAEWGGFVENSNVNRYETSYSAYMTLRVPKEQFDAAIAALKDLSIYVINEYSNAEDVTETYLDLEARLNNMKAEEAQYLAILEKAGTITETLEVTRALSTVRAEIESLESRLQYYDARVDFSSIALSLTEDESAIVANESWRPLSTIRSAIKDWIETLQALVDDLIYLAIFAWPLVLIALIVLAVRSARRKKRN